MQREHQDWQGRNFPADTISGENSFLGMVEEMGEMAHAMLKYKQGIRQMDEHTAVEKIIDAHCDLIIFSFGVAEALGYDLGHELEDTWNRVRTRDWVKDPVGGGES